MGKLNILFVLLQFNWKFVVKKFKIGLKLKITLTLIFVSGISCVILAMLWVSSIKNAHFESSFRQLINLRNIQAERIENYFTTIHNILKVFESNPAIVGASRDFQAGWNELDGVTSVDSLERYYAEWFKNNSSFFPYGVNMAEFLPRQAKTKLLQEKYIINNPFPPGEKQKMVADSKNVLYDQAHARHHQMFLNIKERFGFYDLFLIDHHTGNIIYSIYKENDFGTNLLTGPYSQSNLAKLTRLLMENQDKDTIITVDFQPYMPSYDAPASFFGYTLKDSSGVVGILVAQISIEEINRIMTLNKQWEKNGMGETGEIYLVAEDKTMRSDSRFLVEDKKSLLKQLEELHADSNTLRKIDLYNTSILHQKIDTRAINQALEGKVDSGVIRDYRDLPVLSAYQPLSLPGFQWVITAEMDEGEILSGVNEFLVKVLLVLVGVWCVIIFVSIYFSDRLLSPLLNFIQTAGKISHGDMKARVTINRNDEFEIFANVFNEMAINVETQQQRIVMQKDKLQNAYEELKKMQTQLIIKEKMVTLGTLSAGIAHDLRNPINYISGSAQAIPDLLKDIKAFINDLFKRKTISGETIKALADEHHVLKSFEMAEKLLAKIDKGTLLTVDIINSLRTYTYSTDLKPVQFNLHTNLDATVSITNHLTKNVAKVNKEYSGAPLITGYPGKINQVFVNLISNAADAIQSVNKDVLGTIFIKTLLVHEDGKESVQIKVGDNGCGVPDGLKEKIFDLLFTTKEQGKGTGMGLHMATTIIKEHSGRIDLEEETIKIDGTDERFTVFVVTLPVGASKCM